MAYPEKITKRIASLRHNRTAICANALGTSANFICGSAVRFSLSIDVESRIVADAQFSSNGCGFMLAAADCIADGVINKRLIDLHGLADTDLHEYIQKCLGKIPSERRDCISVCIEALRSAFADFRTRQIEEFQGEKALICTCFGVSEETIETLLSEPGAELSTVEEITRLTNAGSGCGSCRMLIQEMIDRSENVTLSDPA